MVILTRRCSVLVFSCMMPYEQAVCHALTYRKHVSPVFFYKAWLRHRLQIRMRIDMSICLLEEVGSMWVANQRRDKGFWRRSGKHRNVHDGASQAAACVRGRVTQPRGNQSGVGILLQDGAGALRVAQRLGTVAIENVNVHAGSRKEPTAARTGTSAVPVSASKWMPTRAAHHRRPVTLMEHL